MSRPTSARLAWLAACSERPTFAVANYQPAQWALRWGYTLCNHGAGASGTHTITDAGREVLRKYGGAP